jgi:hypothetical protein
MKAKFIRIVGCLVWGVFDSRFPSGSKCIKLLLQWAPIGIVLGL